MARKIPTEIIAAPSAPDNKSRDDWFAHAVETVTPSYEKRGMLLPSKIEWQLVPDTRITHPRIHSYPDHVSDGWAINVPGTSRDVEILLAYVCLGLDMALFIDSLRRQGKEYRSIAVGTALYKRKGVERISRLIGLIKTEPHLELTASGRPLAARLYAFGGNIYTKVTAKKSDPGPVRFFCPYDGTTSFMRQSEYEYILRYRPDRWLKYNRFCFRNDCSRTAVNIPMEVHNYEGDVSDEKVIPFNPPPDGR